MDGVKGFLLTEKAAQGDTEGLQRQLDQCTVSFVFLRNLLKSYAYHLFFINLLVLHGILCKVCQNCLIYLQDQVLSASL